MNLKVISIIASMFFLSSNIVCLNTNGGLLNNILGNKLFYDDLDADFELSRSNILVKNKRSEESGGDIETGGNSKISFDDSKPWPGRWLPEKVETMHRVVSKRLNESINIDRELSMTNSITPDCDDGKTNITVDWTGSPVNYTCFEPQFFDSDPNTVALVVHDYIPVAYHARHVCMKDKIHYSTDLPTFGTHRPAWAKYGEYEFLPIQRWLHNLEHGAIVMLYHPCTHPLLIAKLRDIVTSCLYRHIITPYTLLTEKRPLALVSWGWAMTMSDVDQHNVEQFIREHALKGHEQISKDGYYDFKLKKPAQVVTSIDDEKVCPNSISNVM